MIQPNVVHDKRKKHANGNSLSEYDWNSVKKDAVGFSDKIWFP